MTNSAKWPNVIEIEVNSRCNRRCSYCPNSLSDNPRAQKFMTEELYSRVITEIASINFSGRLSFHLYSEPLLRKDLELLIKFARDRIPFAYFVLYTNGDLLDENRYKALLEAGIDNFLVTRHSWGEYPQRPFQYVQYPSNFTLSSRGGTISKVNEPLDLPCFAPLEMMIVTVNGDVILCHEDAYRQNIMGNLERQSIVDVWNSKLFQNIRDSLIEGKRCELDGVCSTCDNRLYPIMGSSI